MSREHWQAEYLPNGGQVLMLPLAAVYSSSLAEARRILGGLDPFDRVAKLELTFDSIDAQQRLGVLGDLAAFARMERGDSPEELDSSQAK